MPSRPRRPDPVRVAREWWIGAAAFVVAGLLIAARHGLIGSLNFA